MTGDPADTPDDDRTEDEPVTQVDDQAGDSSAVPDESGSSLFAHDEPLVAIADLETRGGTILHLVVLLVGTILVANLLVLTGLDVLSLLNYTEDANPVVYYSVQMSLNFVAMLALALGYLYWREGALLRSHRESLVGIRTPTRRDAVVILAGFVVLLVVMVVSEFLFTLFDVDTAENVAIERGMNHPELFLVLLPIQFLLTAPGEELLFRGVIQGLIRNAYGILPGVLLAAAIFALFHVPALLGSGGDVLPVLLVLFVSGALLGFFYEYTGNLVVPVVIHALWNVLVFGTNYLQAVDVLFVLW